jgi:hypothetical protein
MKQFRLSLAVAVLTLAFSIPTFAGDMQTGVTSQPPTTPAATATGDMETTVAGNMDTTVTANEATATDSLREIALGLMQRVLSLF